MHRLGIMPIIICAVVNTQEMGMNNCNKKMKGFSLLEVLLVLAIVSSVMVLLMNYTSQKSLELRRDKTVIQIQQILNAGMSYYLTSGYWPLKNASVTNTLCYSGSGSPTWTDLTNLKPNYLPPNLANNPFLTSSGTNPYMIGCNTVSNGGGFFLYTTVDTPANASVIAGRLPLAYITTPDSVLNGIPPVQDPACKTSLGANCTTVVASVNIPGQNLNNARSVNFAGVFYSGSCVPAPNCPPGMTPNIFVMPSGVSGVNDTVTCTSSDPSTCTGNIYPMSSFTAFARGGPNPISGGAPIPVAPGSGGASGQGPYDCRVTSTGTMIQEGCFEKLSDNTGSSGTNITSDGTKYWRVCLTVTTQKGLVYPVTGSTYKAQQGMMMGTIVAFTRCVPNKGTENPGGSLDVWQNNIGSTP